jgi:hypothetical protein
MKKPKVKGKKVKEFTATLNKLEDKASTKRRNALRAQGVLTCLVPQTEASL